MILLLNQFDTSVVITQNRTYGFWLLSEIDGLAEKTDDDQRLNGRVTVVRGFIFALLI